MLHELVLFEKYFTKSLKTQRKINFNDFYMIIESTIRRFMYSVYTISIQCNAFDDISCMQT